MPRGRVCRPVPPEGVREPYEQFSYTSLRAELARRKIPFWRVRDGPVTTKVTTKVGFARLLRESDKSLPGAARPTSASTNASDQIPEPAAASRPSPAAEPAAAAAETRVARATASPGAASTPLGVRTPQKAARAVRPRRGCRFRLINVLLSPSFNTRWREMITLGAGKALEVNAFWLDVHVAFNQQNSLFDALHFEDALFVNVEPGVILAHSAARLLQMWVEVVGMYRTAVRSAQQAADAGNSSQSFFDFCAGRLDLLYLHMALLLESELFEFVMGDTIPGSDTMPVAKIKVVDRTGPNAAAPATNSLPRKGSIGNKKEAAGTQEATTPAKRSRQLKLSSTPAAYAMLTVQTGAPAPATGTEPAGANQPRAAAAPTSGARMQPLDMAGMPIQNPELTDPALMNAPAAEAHKRTPPKKNAKSPVRAGERKTTPKSSTAQSSASTTATTQSSSVNDSELSVVVPVIVPPPPPQPGNAPNEADKSPSGSHARPADSRRHHGVDRSGANVDGSVSPDFDAVRQDARPRRRSSGKRRRESSDTSTEIVAVPNSSSHAGSSTDLVPHPTKRFRSTVSTAITPARPATELMLPPDEWDILENRLRKTNENIDRCHRALTGIEANMSDSYRQTLEADLRFFSAIKQRLQEQLLVVMQSGY